MPLSSSIFALLSLIPAVNATAGTVTLKFIKPNCKTAYPAGNFDEIHWHLNSSGKNLTGVVGALLLMNNCGYEQVLAKDVPLLNKTVYNITYTSSFSPPGDDYFIAMASVSVELDYHNRFFRSKNFNITGQGNVIHQCQAPSTTLNAVITPLQT